MDEAAFNVLAEAELTRIEQALEAFDDDIELEVQPGGVLELEVRCCRISLRTSEAVRLEVELV